MESDATVPQNRRFEKGRAAFVILCWFLGMCAFAELLGVGVALYKRCARYADFSLVLDLPAPAKGERGGASSFKSGQDPVMTAKASLQARSVDDILRSLGGGERKGAGAPPPLKSLLLDSVDDEEDKVSSARNESFRSAMSTGSDELDRLIRDARSAQIEGDMRKAILKLEEAQGLHANHPAVLYYFGLTYELLQNSTKAREYYLQVFQQRESAGPFYAEAAKKLQMGFAIAEDMRGKVSFGPITVFHDPDRSEGEKVKLTVPVRIAPGVNIRPEDLDIPVQFFDIVNDREIALTRSEKPRIKWLGDSVTWESGEESFEMTYFLPTLSAEEVMALGDIRYYGYTAKLYYKGEPMDCKSSPNSLILVEYKKKTDAAAADGDYSLLPPIEASPVSDSPLPFYSDDSLPLQDESLLPP